MDALEKAEQEARAIDVLVTDVKMPRMRGTELAQRLKRAHPAIKIVYMSGYLEHDSEDGFIENSAHLQKPFSRETLLKKLRDANRPARETTPTSSLVSRAYIPNPCFSG